MLKNGEFEVEGRPCSWILNGDPAGRILLILGHGAGASYHNDFMVHVAQQWSQLGLAVLRFHFPYMEQMVREEKRRPPNGAKTLLATWRQVLSFTEDWGALRRVVGGKSMRSLW